LPMPIFQRRFFACTASLALLALATGCSGTDEVAPFVADGTLDESDYVANLYAYSSSSTLGVGEYSYITASGGSRPYTYSLIQGDASVNSSSGYLQVFSAGNVTVRVQDSTGATYEVQVTVTTTTTETGTACVYLGDKTQQESGTTEARIDLPAHIQLSRQVIVGLGARLEGDSLMGIFTKVAKLNADGSISTAANEIFTYRTGDLGSTSKGEIYIDLPAGYYLTGIGMASDASGNNLEALKLFGARINSTANVTATIECIVDKDVRFCTTATGSVASKTYFSRYNEYRSAQNKPIVTWGATITGSKVVSRNIATKTITASTTDTGLCPE
jgi:hypothetical protein